MTSIEIKTDIQRIIDEKNLKEQMMYLLVEQCDAVKDDIIAMNLLDTVGKKLNECSETFTKMINEYAVNVDSSLEKQHTFWLDVEKMWNEFDAWRVNFIKENNL